MGVCSLRRATSVRRVAACGGQVATGTTGIAELLEPRLKHKDAMIGLSAKVRCHADCAVVPADGLVELHAVPGWVVVAVFVVVVQVISGARRGGRGSIGEPPQPAPAQARLNQLHSYYLRATRARECQYGPYCWRSHGVGRVGTPYHVPVLNFVGPLKRTSPSPLFFTQTRSPTYAPRAPANVR